MPTSRLVRVVTQGPSEPVRVVTQGIADPVRIISGTPSDPVRVVTSGISNPVKIVEGSLDPIGDVLRANAAAYYKLDEASGTRLDSTSHHADLSFLGLAGKSSAVAGKIGQAIKNFDDPDDPPYLYVDGQSVDISAGYSITGWIKFPQFVPEDDQSFIILTAQNGGGSVTAGLRCGILSDGQPEIGLYQSGLESVPLAIDTWHFVMVSEASGVVTIRVDDLAAVTGISGTNMENLVDWFVAWGASVNNTTDYLVVDEVGLFTIVLSDDQYSYLWNDGTGRTLFP